jgi:uncharacterized membrane protein HdeD (DUF308 family)
MSTSINSVLIGAVAMASLVATLFFLHFWRRTRDSFFLLFAIAFAIDAVSRFVLGLEHVPDETEPFYYVPRLITFSLIILAIVLKNRPRKQR